MVEKFLKQPGGEAVGLTMLGKTAEICVDKVLLVMHAMDCYHCQIGVSCTAW